MALPIPTCTSTFGTTTKSQTTIDLAGGPTPTKILIRPVDGSGDRRVQVSFTIDEAALITLGDNDADGLARIGSAATRRKLLEGTYSYPLVGVIGNLYIKAQSGVTVPEGLSLEFVDGDV